MDLEINVSTVSLYNEFVELMERINKNKITWLTSSMKEKIISDSYPNLLQQLVNQIGNSTINNEIDKKILNREEHTIDEYEFIYNNYVNEKNIKSIVSYIYWKKNYPNTDIPYYANMNLLKKAFKIKGRISEFVYPLRYVCKCYKCGGKMIIRVYDYKFYKFELNCIDCNHREEYNNNENNYHEFGFSYLDNITFTKCSCKKCEELKQDILDFYEEKFEEFNKQVVEKISNQYFSRISKEETITDEYLNEQYVKCYSYLSNEEIEFLYQAPKNIEEIKKIIKGMDLKKDYILYNKLKQHTVIYETRRILKNDEIKFIVLNQYYNGYVRGKQYYSSMLTDEQFRKLYKKLIDIVKLDDINLFFSFIDSNGDFKLSQSGKDFTMKLLWRKFSCNSCEIIGRPAVIIPDNMELHVNPYYINSRQNKFIKINKEGIKDNNLVGQQKTLFKSDAQRLTYNILVKTLSENIIWVNIKLKFIFSLDELILLTEGEGSIEDLLFDFAVYDLNGILLKLIIINERNKLNCCTIEKLKYKLRKVYKIELIVI